MAGLQLGIILGVVGMFGLIVVFMVCSERRERSEKSQISQALGFVSLESDPVFVQRITQLYRGLRAGSSADEYGLRNVSSRRLPDGEMFLFDLIDTSGGESSCTENQAVAVVSPHLDLPAFAIFPRADIDGPLPKLADRVLGWVVSRCGTPIEFPQVPEFGKRYFVSSRDPEAVQRFLDDGKLRRLASTRLLGIHAGGDIFTLSRIDMLAKSTTQETMGNRVEQARRVFSIFVS